MAAVLYRSNGWMKEDSNLGRTRNHRSTESTKYWLQAAVCKKVRRSPFSVLKSMGSPGELGLDNTIPDGDLAFGLLISQREV